ncbi:MAG: hypothetical protein AAFY02_11050 [Pseudomonadota bacterium]
MNKATKTVADLGKEWMQDPAFVREYEALEEEFALASALIEARAQSNLTQEEIAQRMRTSRSTFEAQ